MYRYNLIRNTQRKSVLFEFFVIMIFIHFENHHIALLIQEAFLGKNETPVNVSRVTLLHMYDTKIDYP